MSGLVIEACRFASAALAAVADPSKAPDMQAYMKTEMPFYGVQKAGRATILRELVRWFPPLIKPTTKHWCSALAASAPGGEVSGLGRRPALQGLRRARSRSRCIGGLIVEGAWWDLVDEVATHLICDLVVGHPEAVWPTVDTWIDDDDMWLRRTAIICQVGAKEETDAARLFRFCEARAFETEFFIRKAIGWALRQHARVDPDAVARFVIEHRDQLSGLSYREATKHIGHLLPS